MSQLRIDLERSDADFLGQVSYALGFVSEDVRSYAIENDERVAILLELRDGADEDDVTQRIHELLARYDQDKFGMKTAVYYANKRDLRPIDAWSGMLERKWITPVGEGHVILRGIAAELLALVDHKVEMFAREFDAELEYFPSTIRAATLDRCHHYTSFPEHMDFVSHLKQDLRVLQKFSGECREKGWSPQLHDGNMAACEFAISPSCCYHAYEGMEGWDLERPGRCITATIQCHRYEAANHISMSRLRSFTMREVVWVGEPAYIISNRAKADELIVEWARDWELSCTFEVANDMFFTDDYAVKASFQRQQEGKKELRLDVPSEGRFISCFSSNFHAKTFGKAFSINAGGRVAASGCIGWGYERWVYAIISQFGYDPKDWPAGLQRDYEEFLAARRVSKAAIA